MSLKTEIRRYVLLHADAAETCDGVVRVWLDLPRSEELQRLTQAALEALVDEEFLERHRLPGEVAIYRKKR